MFYIQTPSRDNEQTPFVENIVAEKAICLRSVLSDSSLIDDYLQKVMPSVHLQCTLWLMGYHCANVRGSEKWPKRANLVGGGLVIEART